MPVPHGRPPLRQPGPHTPRLANYRIEARLDAAQKRITATEKLFWKHAGNAPVSSLPLHLYLNAFKNETSLFMRESRGGFRRASMKEGGWGWIDVSSIQLGGQELRPAATFGADETTLSVPLPQPVSPGQTVELELTFTAQLPAVFARTGYAGEFLLVGQWFPKVGVLEVLPTGQRWHCEPFHAQSEFYADFGVYDVTLTAPETHVIAATGVLTAVDSPGPGLRRHVYHAEDVHDFAWMADPHMRFVHAVADGDVDVYVFHRPEQEAFARRHLDAAVRTLETFGRWFGAYPFTVMNVIDPPPGDAAEGAGGMEYPMFVTTSGDAFLTSGSFYEPELVTIHEVGHNWFQGILASNEVDEAFLDEGVNEYVDGLLMDDWFGPERSVGELFGLRLGYYPAHRAAWSHERYPTAIATRSYEFPSFGEYGSVTYAKTTNALKTLEGVVGREALLSALGVYARRFAFRHPTRADFFATLQSHLGTVFDVEGYLKAAFVERGEVDFRVADVRVRRARPPRGVFGEGEGRKRVDKTDEGAEWLGDVLLHRLGEVSVPVDVELIFADGSRARRRWDGRGSSIWLEHRGPSELVEVIVDPDGRLTLEHEVAKNGWRRPYTRPAWRAAARAGFWEQTLLQLVGL
jgi:hypothetical protein